MKFKIEQLAIVPQHMTAAAMTLLNDMGMNIWTRDRVSADGYVFGDRGENEANLSFNYHDLTENKSVLEFEVLEYVHGDNWMRGRDPSASHIGMHCSEIELDSWKAFFNSRKIGTAQEVWTNGHTNPYLIEQRRHYHYCIFDTRRILGIDVKFIVRID